MSKRSRASQRFAPPRSVQRALSLGLQRNIPYPQRIPGSVDRFAEQLSAETGIPVQRAEAARQLLEAGLRAKERRTNRKSRRATG